MLPSIPSVGSLTSKASSTVSSVPSIGALASKTGLGMETRPDILPQMKVEEGPGILGPDYDFSDNLPMPADVGVRTGSSFGDVYDAMKGVAYYVDMVGFGGSTNGLTSGMPVKPLGVRYALKTGQTCPNGEPMYHYVNGIPEGTALGTKVQKALAGVGLPGLRGLGPGILEDAEDALDPRPIVNSVFGTGYPACELKELEVGDQDNRIRNPETGNSYIVEPKTAYQRSDGQWVQKRWVQKRDGKGRPISLTKAEYDAQGGGKKEGFLGGFELSTNGWVVIGAIGLSCILLGVGTGYLRK